jgi:predicted nucleic acid-binding Zn ribbon protein
MRRRAPRPLSLALDGVVERSQPATVLGRAQGAWTEVAGPGLARFAEPVSERDGVLTVTCESATWAQELELLGPDLLTRLNEALGGREGVALKRLRFVVGSAPN